MRRLAATLAVVVGTVAALPGCGGPADPFLGKPPPPLASATGTWLGTDAPLDTKGLIGNVVLLQFGFLR